MVTWDRKSRWWNVMRWEGKWQTKREPKTLRDMRLINSYRRSHPKFSHLVELHYSHLLSLSNFFSSSLWPNNITFFLFTAWAWEKNYIIFRKYIKWVFSLLTKVIDPIMNLISETHHFRERESRSSRVFRILYHIEFSKSWLFILK